jgi:histone H3/H4
MGRLKQVTDTGADAADGKSKKKPLKPAQAKANPKAVLKAAARRGNAASAKALEKVRSLKDENRRLAHELKKMLKKKQAKPAAAAAAGANKKYTKGQRLFKARKEALKAATDALKAQHRLNRKSKLSLNDKTLERLQAFGGVSDTWTGHKMFVSHCLNQVIDEVVRVSLAMAGHRKHHTIQRDDVDYAARFLNLLVYLPASKKGKVTTFSRKLVTGKKAVGAPTTVTEAHD